MVVKKVGLIEQDGFVDPMKCKTFSVALPPGDWVAEEKFDGHRLIVACGRDGLTLFKDIPSVHAWSRNHIERTLPPHVREALEKFPAGIYDGELTVPGKRSYGVTELANQDELVFVVFDVIEALGMDVTRYSYNERRYILQQIFDHGVDTAVRLAISTPIPKLPTIESNEWIKKQVEKVWGRDGEGLILKRTQGTYQIGKRSGDWLKIKDLKSEVMTVVGFREGRLGPHSVVLLRDDAGNETTVKALNNAELAKIETGGFRLFLGRKLRIEYQERTPDGSYRHPRWDRWEDE